MMLGHLEYAKAPNLSHPPLTVQYLTLLVEFWRENWSATVQPITLTLPEV